MNAPKHQFIVGCLVLVAFLWGYKRDSIESALAELISGMTTSAPESPTPGLLTSGMRSGAATVPPRPVTPDPFGNAYKSVGGGQPTVNPEGPAAGNPTAMVVSPFSGNLEAIRQGKIQEGQSTQRNAYFDKLSEQMKQLRGSQTIPEQPPRPTTPEPSVVDNPPPPPQPSPTARLNKERANSPAIEVPGVTGAHPEFSIDEGDEEDDTDEELDNLEDELAEIEQADDDEEEP